MPWLLPAVIASLSTTLVLILVFGFLYLQYRERHLALWSWAWGFYALRFVFALCGITDLWRPSEAQDLVQLAVLASGLLLLRGTFSFIGRPMPWGWTLSGLAGAAWIYLTHLHETHFFVQNLPVFLFYGLILIWTGILFLRSHQSLGLGKHLCGWSLILWGLHKADYPFLRSVEWFAPWGYLLGSFLALAVAMGMLLSYFQRVRSELQQSESRFRTLVEQASDSIFLHDTQGRFLEVNQQACESLGYTRDELLNMSVQDIELSAKDQSLEDLWTTWPDGHSLTLDGQHRRKDGSCFPTEVRLGRIEDPQRGPLYLALARNVTKKKAAEKALREQSRLLQTIINAIPAPIFYKDEKGIYLGCNKAFETLTGRPAAEIIGQSVYGISPAELADIYHRADLELMEKGTTQVYEASIESADSSRRDVMLHKAVFYKESGQPGGLVGTLIDISERRRMEEKLRRSEQKFRAIFNQTFQFIGLLSPEGILLQANSTSLRTIGAMEQEVIGKPFWDTPWWNHDPVQQDRLQQAVARAQGGELVRMETFHPTQSGDLVHIDFSLKPVFNEADEVIYLIPEGRDITERKLVENTLKATKNTLETLFKSAPLPIVALDHHDRVTLWNPCAEDLFGWKAEDILGTRYPLVPEQGKDEHQNILNRVLQGEGSLSLEVQRKKRDGTVLDMHLSTAPLIDGQNRVMGVIGILEDVTEQQQARLLLQNSESKYRKLFEQFSALLDGIPDLLLQVSPDLEIVWANRSANEQFAPKTNGLKGRGCQELWNNHAVPCEQCLIADCFSSGQIQEDRLESADGRTWGVKTFPIKNSRGQVENVIIWASDISEKIKLREEALRADRLATLGELSAGVAHEINNPNGLFLINLPVLFEAFSDAMPILELHYCRNGDFTLGSLSYSRMKEEIPEMLTEMQDGAQRIRRIVEDLKNFSRKVPEGALQTVDLNASLKTALRLTGSELRKATHNFECNYADLLPAVRGISQRIEQVLVNLLINACQALGSPDKAIRVRTFFDPDKQQSMVEVEDEGCGIAPKDLPHITDPFFTTRRECGGTGLGLSVSARIVKEHGGRLVVQSTQGWGTTVTLTLPAIKEDQTP